MNFTTFWAELARGGETTKGDKYTIVGGDRLHIKSPGNKNKSYHIKKDTVEKYINIDIPGMSERDFRYAKSSYFYNIYKHITKDS